MKKFNFSESGGTVLCRVLAPFALLMALCFQGVAQQVTVSGTVEASQGSTPPVGVTVKLVGAATGTTTDAEGHFSQVKDTITMTSAAGRRPRS